MRNKKTLAVLLAFCMIVTMIPVSAFGTDAAVGNTDTGTGTPAISENTGDSGASETDNPAPGDSAPGDGSSTDQPGTDDRDPDSDIDPEPDPEPVIEGSKIEKISKLSGYYVRLYLTPAKNISKYQISRSYQKTGTKIVSTTSSTSVKLKLTSSTCYFKVRTYKYVDEKKVYTPWSAVRGFSRDNGAYWIKVNEKQNVMTVYRKSYAKWVPVKAFLCSCGVRGCTPNGTFKIRKRWDWGAMFGGVYARYVCQFKGNYLIHSVPYKKKKDPSSQPTAEFNKLGTAASHGCVRLSVRDSKWVYKNCKNGTKVTVYRSSNPGPLGKPKGIKVSTKKKTNWDPTDPSPKNPFNR